MDDDIYSLLYKKHTDNIWADQDKEQELIINYQMLTTTRREIRRLAKEVVNLEKKVMSVIEDISHIVFSTKYGRKYHTGQCHYIKKQANGITLEKAVSEGLEECKICIGNKKINN
jgi:hypothetical protein